MPLPSDVLEEIESLVRSGFFRRERIIQILCEEAYEPGELDPMKVAAGVDAALGALQTERATWPDVTDCDRLDAVFDALRRRGVIALQNAGYTQSDGFDDFRAAYDRAGDKSRIFGYCFYHGQDLQRAVAGNGLYLAFGPVDPEDEQTKGPEVGRVVSEELQRAGFGVDWDGTFNKRIRVPRFDWKRR